MRLTIGVMGSSGGDLDDAVLGKTYRLGETIAAREAVLITGGCPGLPYAAVRGAKARGGLVIGISRGLSLDEHRGMRRDYRTEHLPKASCFGDARPEGSVTP